MLPTKHSERFIGPHEKVVSEYIDDIVNSGLSGRAVGDIIFRATVVESKLSFKHGNQILDALDGMNITDYGWHTGAGYYREK